MGNYRCIPGIFGHFYRGDGLREGADLVDFDEDWVGDLAVNTMLQDTGIGDKEVIPHELNFVT